MATSQPCPFGVIVFFPEIVVSEHTHKRLLCGDPAKIVGRRLIGRKLTRDDKTRKRGRLADTSMRNFHVEFARSDGRQDRPRAQSLIACILIARSWIDALIRIRSTQLHAIPLDGNAR